MARPMKCDCAEALEKATALFWERGYAQASIADLVKATGLLPGSLYARYGSKEGLLMQCIHHYAKKSSELYEEAEKAASPLGRIEALLEIIARDATQTERQWGCFLMNCAMDVAPGNEEISAVTSAYRNESETWVSESLQDAVDAGELSSELDVEEMTVNVFGIIYAMRAMSRAQDAPERIRHYKDSTLKALLDPWRSTSVV